MKAVVGAEARAFRRAVGVMAWAVLEELALCAELDEHGSLVAHTNVRALAAQLGVGKDTVARAVAGLDRAGVVRRVVAERGARGALPSSSYVVDLEGIDGLSIETNASTNSAHAIARRSPRHAPRVDETQTSLFDLPASVS